MSRPAFVDYNGTMYAYVHNLQGDIVGILDNTGALVVTYGYDAWGKPVQTSGSMANTLGKINPFRYRGYVFDEETELYYLQSRYYDPQAGRFINSDSRADNSAGVLSNNLYLYVANNPIIQLDPSGHGIVKKVITWLVDKVAKPAIKYIRNTMDKLDIAYSGGINIGWHPFFLGIGGQLGVSIDPKGNVAFQGSYSGGVYIGSPGISASISHTLANEPSISKLSGEDPSFMIGGSTAAPVCGVPLGAGLDINILPDSNEDTVRFGGTASVGLSSPGSEVHALWVETKTIGKPFNIWNLTRTIYERIMEWAK